MKNLLSVLLIIMLFGCSSPVARTVAASLGNKVKQCCASLSSPDKKPVSLAHSDEGNSGDGGVSIFEDETKLIHTW